MTDHDNNAAAVLPERRTPNAERCPVVEFVTSSTNLKTEDLKTVTPKKHTNFAALPQFWCNSERPVLSRSKGRTPTACPERVGTSGRVEWAEHRPVVDPAPCSLFPEPCLVVDLVTSCRNLKTEDLKTVTPQKHTNFPPQPQFPCNSERPVLSRSKGRTRTACPERVRNSGRVEWAEHRPVVDPAPCTLYPQPCPVVDLVTSSRNLKTKEIKTVTPQKVTRFSPLPGLQCISERCTLNAERWLLRLLPPPEP
jgi:hypothetical protein